MPRTPFIRSLITTAVAAALISRALVSYAGPTVIRDEMLRDTAVTPTLGRGYSIATNTYQSVCLANIVKTKPSYNFNFLFQEIDEKGSIANSSSSRQSSSYFYYFNVGFAAGGGAGSQSSRYDEATKKTWNKHSILVTILVDVYYNSIDESATKMSPSAAALITAKDIPGFFDACGMYYVRSISRQASLFSKFSYESESSKRDTSFETHLKTAVAAFSTFGGGGGTSSRDESGSSSTSFSATNLTIQTIGMGIGKNESVMLVSYDLATFKNAVKGAFQATQPDDVGLVTAIEVAPWVENTEFQALHKLTPVQVPELDANGKEIMEPQADPALPPRRKMKTIMPYAQKRMLTQNSEFLAEADRASRAKLNTYYKAKACKSQIEMDHMTSRGGRWSFREMIGSDDDRSMMGVYNNRTGDNPQTLGWLYKLLGPEEMNRLWLEYDSFVYGGLGPDVEGIDANPTAKNKMTYEYLTGANNKLPPYPRNLFPGASRCLEELVEAGLEKRSYRTIKSCERLEELFMVVNGRDIDDYCMPAYAPGPDKAGK